MSRLFSFHYLFLTRFARSHGLMSKSFFTLVRGPSILSFTLCAAFVTGWIAPLHAVDRDIGPSAPVVTEEMFDRELYRAAIAKNPMLESLAQSEPLPLPDLSLFDDLEDENPYFVRNQKWSQCARQPTENTPESIFVDGNEGARNSTVVLTEQQRCLELPMPAHFLASNEEFVLFSSSLTDEGFFFIETNSLLASSQTGDYVPVHFFPLPQGELGFASYQDALAGFLLADFDESPQLAVSVADMRMAVKWQLNNMQMAIAENSEENAPLIRKFIREQSHKPLADMGELKLLPRPNSTSAFGLVFRPSFTTKISRLNKGVRALWERLLPEAHAMSPETYATLVQRLTEAGTVLGIMYAASVVLKYTFLKDKVMRARELRLAREAMLKGSESTLPEKSKPKSNLGRWLEAVTQAMQQVKNSTLGQMGQIPGVNRAAKLARDGREWLREVNDVFAGVLTAAGQSAYHSVANILIYQAQNSFPERLGAKGTLWRMFLDNTYLAVLGNYSNIASNEKTFFLGCIVMGVTDSAMVGVQSISFIPHMLQELRPFVNESLQQQIDSVFNPANEHTSELIAEDVVRNFIAWMGMGSLEYASMTQQSFEGAIRSAVRKAMEDQGLSVEDNAAEFERRVNAAIQLEFIKYAMPPISETMLQYEDLTNLIRRGTGHVAESLGPSPTEVVVDADGHQHIEKIPLLGEDMPGWVRGALKVTLKDARRREAAEPGSYTEVIQLLESLNKDIAKASSLRPIVNWFQVRRRVSRTLTLLTQPIDFTGRRSLALPELWGKGYSRSTAYKAAWLYQRTAHALEHKLEYLRKIKPDDWSRLAPAAETFVLESYKKNPGESAVDGMHSLRVEDAVVRALRAEEARKSALAYAGPVKGEMSHFQHRRAFVRTQQKLLIHSAESGAESGDSTSTKSESDLRLEFNQEFARQLAAEVDLYPELDSPFVRKVHEKSLKSAESYEEKTLGFKEYYDGLSEEDKALTRAGIYGEAFLGHYSKMAAQTRDTVNPEDMDWVLPTFSTEKPGMLQNARRKGWVQRSKIATVTLRALEGIVNAESGHSTGLASFFARHVYFAYDTVEGFKTSLRMFFPKVTGEYLYMSTLFGMQIHWGTYCLFAAMRVGITTPQRILQRVLNHVGIRPMGGILSKVAYGIPYAWVTFGPTIPMMLYAKEANAFVDNNIANPVKSAFITCTEMMEKVAHSLGGG